MGDGLAFRDWRLPLQLSLMAMLIALAIALPVGATSFISGTRPDPDLVLGYRFAAGGAGRFKQTVAATSTLMDLEPTLSNLFKDSTQIWLAEPLRTQECKPHPRWTWFRARGVRPGRRHSSG